MKFNKKLIVALDVTERFEAFKIAKDIYDLVDAIKVNYPLVLSCGIEIVKGLSAFAPVLCDLKVADIPNTNKLIVKQVVKKGAVGVIVHGFVGKDSVKACIDAAEGKDVFVVTEMSHPGAEEFTAPVAFSIAKLAVTVGASGVIAPATRPERVREIRKIVGNLKILCPGVGTQGGEVSVTIKAGADAVIVGRSIYEAKNPRRVAEALIDEIKGTLILSAQKPVSPTAKPHKI